MKYGTWAMVALYNAVSFVCAKPWCSFDDYMTDLLVCIYDDTDYSLQRGLVSDNETTFGVVLHNCSISSAAIDSFYGLPSLQWLDLTYNKIRILKLGVFDELASLTYLSLAFNLLTTLPVGLLDHNPELNNLNLSGNFLTNVPVDTFRGNKLLKLDLSENRITYLKDNFCGELNSLGNTLTYFFFHLNPWQCACLNELLREVKGMNIFYDNIKYDGKTPICVTKKEFTCKRQAHEHEVYLNMYNDLF